MKIYHLALWVCVLTLSAPKLEGVEWVGSVYEVGEVEGKVFVRDLSPERRLGDGDLLHEGARLRTGWGSSAKIRNDSSGIELRLGQRSRVTLSISSGGRTIDVERGRVRINIAQRDSTTPSRHAIKIPYGELSILDGDFGLSVSRHGSTLLVVFSGTVEVRQEDGSSPALRLEGGSFIRIHRGQPDGLPQPHDTTESSWDRGEDPWQRDLMAWDFDDDG